MARGSHRGRKPLSVQIVYLEISDQYRTYRIAEMDPPQAVQTIFITYYTHREDMVASLYFLIVKSKGQRSSSVSPTSLLDIWIHKMCILSKKSADFLLRIHILCIQMSKRDVGDTELDP